MAKEHIVLLQYAREVVERSLAEGNCFIPYVCLEIADYAKWKGLDRAVEDIKDVINNTIKPVCLAAIEAIPDCDYSWETAGVNSMFGGVTKGDRRVANEFRLAMIDGLIEDFS